MTPSEHIVAALNEIGKMDSMHRELMLRSVIRECRARQEPNGLAYIADVVRSNVMLVRRLREPSGPEKVRVLQGIIGLAKSELTELDCHDPCVVLTGNNPAPCGVVMGE